MRMEDVADRLVCGQRVWRMDRSADRGCGGISGVAVQAVSAPGALDDGGSGGAASHASLPEERVGLFFSDL